VDAVLVHAGLGHASLVDADVSGALMSPAYAAYADLTGVDLDSARTEGLVTTGALGAPPGPAED